ncbi:MAG TPA: hypothetical protein PKN32_00260 [Bacteroidales bacterium]|nr:hypothetical protein [Bacteroidales bacterium]
MENKIRLIKTFIKQSSEDTSGFLSLIREFDANGNLIFTKEYDEDNNVIFENKLVFNENDKLIVDETINYQDNYGEKKTYLYGDDGKLISERIDYEGGWFSIKKYERDSEKRILKITCFDENDELEEITETEFNEQGDIVCRKEFDENNRLKQMTVNTYKEDGILILKEEYTNSKKPDKIHHYFYNDNNKITAVQTLNSSGRQLDWVKIEYDDNGLPISQINMSGAKIILEHDIENRTIIESHYNNAGKIMSISKTIRDKDGNIVEEHSDDTIKSYVYEYF